MKDNPLRLAIRTIILTMLAALVIEATLIRQFAVGDPFPEWLMPVHVIRGEALVVFGRSALVLPLPCGYYLILPTSPDMGYGIINIECFSNACSYSPTKISRKLLLDTWGPRWSSPSEET